MLKPFHQLYNASFLFGLIVIVATASNCVTARAESAAVPTGIELFSKFNLRTMRSSLGPQLKAYCGNTFADIIQWDSFKGAEVEIKEHELHIETDDWAYSMNAQSNIVSFSDNAKNASYQWSGKVPVGYNELTGYWVAVSGEAPIESICDAREKTVSNATTTIQEKANNPIGLKGSFSMRVSD